MNFMRKLLALAILALVLPLTASAEAVVRADDSVAGLGTDIDLLGFPPKADLQVVVSPPFGAERTLGTRTDAEGNASVQLTGRDTEVAGLYRVDVQQRGAALGQGTEFEILADSFSPGSSAIQLGSDTLLPDGRDTVAVTVVLRDQYGNPLPERPLKLISSRSTDRITSLQSETDETGQQVFSLSTKEPGEIFLRAIDLLSGMLIDTEAVAYAESPLEAMGGSRATTAENRRLYGGSSNLAGNVLGRSLYGQVGSFGLVDHLVVEAPPELEVNEDATIRIVAVDRSGNRVEDYVGLVLLSSTDPLAFLPVGGEVRFEPRNLGEKVLTLGLRFRSPDEHILYAEDSENPEIFGQAYVTVTGGGGGNVTSRIIQINEPKVGTVFNVPEVTVKGVTEPFVNLMVSGGSAEVKGDTNIDGAFAITVQLDPSKEQHVLRVKDEFGQLDSGEFAVILDNRPPAFESISFSPEAPVEGTNVLLVVKSEANLPQITAQINGAEIVPLEPAPGQPGTYQHLFVAPAAGAYQPVIAATDAAGNSAQQTSSLVVELKGLPKVQGLQAFPETNAVTLEWEPLVSETADAYRIYVGESPTKFDFTLDTDFATTAAQVAGLRPGTKFFFAVTALQGNRESEEFDVVSAMVKGLRLSVTPQNASLLIDWSSLVTDTPLSSFILEYGVEPDAYTEKRVLNGELRKYVQRDLINDVTYFFKLTPVDVTGQLVEDLSATAEGTPSGNGFVITPGDSVPFDTTVRTVARTVPPPEVHQSAPQTASTGLPTGAWWVLTGSAAAGLLIYWQRRRKLQTTIAFLQAMESRYRQR